MAIASLANDLAMALDPVALSEAIGRYPDRWQRDVLRSTSNRLLLNCSRQSGKSTTVSTLCCHTAIYQPGSLSLILSPGERQSKETFRKVLDVYKALGRPIPADAETKLELELRNGSRIVALPGNGDTIRGYSGVDLMLIDEASRVEEKDYHTVRPMLAVSGGRLIALSTPKGKRGWWFEAWEYGSDWEKFKVTALDCPRITQAFLDEERANLPESVYLAEYMGVFTDAIDNVFKEEHIKAMFDTSVKPLFPVGVYAS